MPVEAIPQSTQLTWSIAGISRTSALATCLSCPSSNASSSAGRLSFRWNTASRSGAGSSRARSAWIAVKCRRSTASVGSRCSWYPLPLPLLLAPIVVLLLLLRLCEGGGGGSRGALSSLSPSLSSSSLVVPAPSKQAYRRSRSSRKPPRAPKTLMLWTRWQLAP